MELGFVRGLITVLTLAVFLGICWWAYRPGNKSRFDADAMLPFADGEGDAMLPFTESGGDAMNEADQNGGALR